MGVGGGGININISSPSSTVAVCRAALGSALTAGVASAIPHSAAKKWKEVKNQIPRLFQSTTPLFNFDISIDVNPLCHLTITLCLTVPVPFDPTTFLQKAIFYINDLTHSEIIEPVLPQATQLGVCC